MSTQTLPDDDRATSGRVLVEDVHRWFPSGERDRTSVIANLSLEVRPGELVTLFGPNGCGKTTLLNLVAGLERPDAGTVDRDPDATLGYVFQSYADTLLPWRTVRGNVALPLRARRRPRAEIDRLVDTELARYGLAPYAERYPYQLSGGLRQLVAIARATVYRPGLLLLDEPFSALDYATAHTIWRRFRDSWTARAVTTLCVSHDLDEAIFLGDRVCVLAPRPTHVVACIDVPLGPERDASVLTTDVFQDLRAAVLGAFGSTSAVL